MPEREDFAARESEIALIGKAIKNKLQLALAVSEVKMIADLEEK